jgi:hypothetical protein
MYWYPIINYKGSWSGKALPLPLLTNNSIKNSDKLITTPLINNFDYSSFDLTFTNSFSKPNSGLKISLSGRLKGISKAKSLVISQGVIKKQTISNPVDYYSRPIYTKWGTIGLKVLC